MIMVLLGLYNGVFTAEFITFMLYFLDNGGMFECTSQYAFMLVLFHCRLGKRKKP